MLLLLLMFPNCSPFAEGAVYVSYPLSHDQDTIIAEKGCAEMHDFHMAALMFLTNQESMPMQKCTNMLILQIGVLGRNLALLMTERMRGQYLIFFRSRANLFIETVSFEGA